MAKVGLNQTSLTQVLESLIGEAPNAKQRANIRIFTEDYLSRLKSLQPQSGIVTPNGNVVSNDSRQYYDTVGAIMYFNPNSGEITGWVAI